MRYRGYYLDSETEFYYLQSRYYDAKTSRFINADEATMLKLTGMVRLMQIGVIRIWQCILFI